MCKLRREIKVRQFDPFRAYAINRDGRAGRPSGKNAASRAGLAEVVLLATNRGIEQDQRR
jgi:DNA helicase HerA-like ATPase